MTPEQQRIAIAEWMGLIPKDTGTSRKWEYDINSFPDYPNDLNAIHEAEKKLDGVQQREYLRQLYHAAVELKADEAGVSTDVLCNEDEMYIVASASANERSEALCRTLWPERFES